MVQGRGRRKEEGGRRKNTALFSFLLPPSSFLLPPS
jgi:hypothetical protein